MNSVEEAKLRSWAGQLRNGAYRARVLEAAEEIGRLERDRNALLVATKDGFAFVNHTLEFWQWSWFAHLRQSVEELRDKMRAVIAQAEAKP